MTKVPTNHKVQYTTNPKQDMIRNRMHHKNSLPHLFQHMFNFDNMHHATTYPKLVSFIFYDIVRCYHFLWFSCVTADCIAAFQEDMSENKNEPSENLCKLRKMSARLSFLSQTDGSCALEQGNTVIWCTVNGPGDATSTKRDNERLIINVAHNDIDSTQNTTKVIFL